MPTTLASDATPLHFEVIEGPGPTLVFTNGYATSSFYWRHVLEHLTGRARLITWDLRGHGKSGPARDLDALTIAACADDLARVMDAAGADQAALLGFSFGCQVTLEAWRHFPQRIRAIIPILGTFEHPFNHVMSPLVGPALFQVFKRAAPRLGSHVLSLVGATAHTPLGYLVARQTGQVEPSVPFEHMQPFFEHFRDLDGPTWAALGIAAQAHSARDLLPTITVPTLVIGGGKDDWTPPAMSRHMHQAIPGAELLFLPEAGHTGLLGHAHKILPALDDFLTRHALLSPS